MWKRAKAKPTPIWAVVYEDKKRKRWHRLIQASTARGAIQKAVSGGLKRKQIVATMITGRFSL